MTVTPMQVVARGIFPKWPNKSTKTSVGHTVDGRNPAPGHMENIILFAWFFTSQVVQDFFQQQYAPGEHVLQLRDSFEGIIPLLVGNPYEPPF